jgi:hypothetical protein
VAIHLLADDPYLPGPDWLPQPGVPESKLFEFTFDHSMIFYVPGETDDSGAGTFVMDRGRLYAATRMGMQVFDGASR